MVEKLERQMSLLATLLQNERPLLASDIQYQVDGYADDKTSFRRTFERDKEDLRRLGVPIGTVQVATVGGYSDGYQVRHDDYYLHDLGLEPDETVALSMALRLIKLEGAEAEDALWKLGGAAGNETQAEIGEIAMGPAVSELHQTIKRRVSVRFDYRGQARLVEPWRLAFRRGHWYLHAYDVERADSRSFRLDRVEGGFEVDERPATQPRGQVRGERQPWEFGEPDDAKTARIAVDASHASWARHHLGRDSVVAEHDDGSIEVELQVTNSVGFRNLVLGMLDGAEVLSPPDLRTDMVGWLQALAASGQGSVPAARAQP